MTLFFSAWALVALGFTLTAVLCLRRRRYDAPLPAVGSLLLLRPVDAPTRVEVDNLTQVPAGVTQRVLSPQWVPGARGKWVRSDPRTRNRKLGHLLAALPTQADARPVLVVDADVRVDEALVRALLGGLEAGAALSWAAPTPAEPGVERGLLVQSAHSFEVLDAVSPGAAPLCGKAMALSPAAMEVLRALPDCVGEDLELSLALHRRGLRVRQVARAHIPGFRPAADAHARFARWMQVLRAHRGGLFPSVPIFFACTPVLLLAAVLCASLPLTGLVAAVVLARQLLSLRLEGRLSLWWLPGEALLLASWLHALRLGSKVTWRGRVLHLGPSGALCEVAR